MTASVPLNLHISQELLGDLNARARHHGISLEAEARRALTRDMGRDQGEMRHADDVWHHPDVHLPTAEDLL